MSTSGVHAFVACTSRKRHRPAPGLQLRHLKGSVTQRATEWTNRLGSASLTVSALDLYTGNSWYVARDLRTGLNGACRLWALSAGFGLLGTDDDIAPYGATLTGGHADSVVRSDDLACTSNVARRWWGALCDWPGPESERTAHRQIASVAAERPDDLFVVCAGRSYVDAMVDDLVLTARRLAVRERLIVFGSSECPDGRLKDSWVQVPSRVRLVVGGAMNSLFVRVARRALVEAELLHTDAPAARAAVNRMAASVEQPVDVRRDRVSDDRIADWIAGELYGDESLSKTTALRKFRHAGWACEQNRFGRLFDETKVSFR